MSRSRRHVPIMGNCGGSEKHDKRLAARRLRTLNKKRVRQGEEPLSTFEVSNIDCTGNKDGKHYFDVEKYPEGMRK